MIKQKSAGALTKWKRNTRSAKLVRGVGVIIMDFHLLYIIRFYYFLPILIKIFNHHSSLICLVNTLSLRGIYSMEAKSHDKGSIWHQARILSVMGE